MQPMTSPKGFFASLFDFSFSSLITTRIIKVVYIIITIALGLGAIGVFISLISQGGAAVIFAIIAVPIGWLLYMIWARISLEVLIIIFRIGDDVRHIAYPPGPYPGFPPGSPPGAPPPPSAWGGWQQGGPLQGAPPQAPPSGPPGPPPPPPPTPPQG